MASEQDKKSELNPGAQGENPKSSEPEAKKPALKTMIKGILDPEKIKKAVLSLNIPAVFKAIKSFNIKKLDVHTIKKNYFWILLGVLIVSLVFIKTAGYIKSVMTRAEKAKEMVEFVETIPVKVYKVKRMDFKDTLPVMGRVEGFKEIELKFETSGIIESFNFEEGERILEGDIIASLSQKDALLKLKYAALEMEKAQKIYDLGGHDKVAVEQKKLEYESAKRDLEKTNIYASADGYLGSRDKNAGSYISSQDKVGTFVDFTKVYGTFDVIEEDSPKVSMGQNVEIFIDAVQGETFAGTVDMISPMIEGRTRTQKVKVELDNEKSELKPGMFARGIINTYEKKDALIIPSAAFKKKEQKYYVYVIHPAEEGEGEEVAAEGTEQKDEKKPEKKKEVKKEKRGKEKEKEEAAEEAEKKNEGIVEEREVEIAYLTHDMAEIGKGLEEGELIIRELHQEYKDKDKVEITEVQETIF